MILRSIAIASLVWSLADAAHAQQRPLLTEDPETVGTGRVLLEAGLTHSRDRTFTGSGLTGDLLEVPQVGLSIGVGPIAEIQIDGGFYSRLHITSREEAPLSDRLELDGDTTTSVDDIVVGAKIKLVAETAGRPAFGLRLVTKLPNASNESGLGLNTMDFYATLLVGKTVGSVRFVGNGGLGILSDPIEMARQTDVLPYGFSIARAIADGLEVVGEVNGHVQFSEEFPPPGAESHAVFRAGVRYTRGPGRVDAGMLIGTTSKDPSIGFTVGYTHVFNAFTVP
jgi:Putative MetA-pathway of phenol degradation